MPPSHPAKIPGHPRSADQKLIDLSAALPRKLSKAPLNGILSLIEKVLALDAINAIHQATETHKQAGEFCEACLSALNVNYTVSDQELAGIPASGPMVMMANHPFGGLEGIILAGLLLEIRPDVRILANYLLTRIPALKPKIIPVDPINPKKSARANAKALKVAMQWVSNGGALLTFPAGEVSHLNLKSAQIIDPPWSPHIAKIILQAKAKALPVYIHGRNSVLFNILGLLNPRLRTLMLPREVINKRTTTVHITMGKPIAWRKLADFPSPTAMTNFLRFNTYLLKHRMETGRPWKSSRRTAKLKPQYHDPLIAPIPRSQLNREIESLPEEHRLVTHKEFQVFLTTSEQSPEIMREIGRLRETSFRDVGEGTGKCMDIDRFDKHYLQLLLWNTQSKEIVGAYRMGRTDQILNTMGMDGLYSTTLFNYKQQFLSRMGHSLELGRSFIRTNYQKKFGCLAILWRGIGEFVARNNRYRYLFGPVSISQNYHSISKNLMVAFLKHHTLDPKLSPLVKPKRPVKIRNRMHGTAPFTFIEKEAIDGVSMLISEIEKDRKGVPTLIKHYLKLNGRFLAFNLDREFSNVIDGLVVVDLLKTDPKLLQRFMGESGTQSFYNHHCPEMSNAAA